MGQLSVLISRHPVSWFLLLTFAISWSLVVWISLGRAGLLSYEPSILWLVLLGQFGPSLAALIVVAARSGRPGVGELLRGLTRWRLGIRAWSIILLFIPASFAFGYGIHLVLGGDPLPGAALLNPTFAGTLLGGALVGLVFGGLSEELGWRGFLLPRLQLRMSPLQASVILALVWSVWHLEPDYLAAGLTDGWMAFFEPWRRYMFQFVMEAVQLTLIMTALWNRTDNSLFSAVVIHSVSNACISAIPEEWRPLAPTLKWSLIAFEWVFAMLAVWWLGEGRRMLDGPLRTYPSRSTSV